MIFSHYEVFKDVDGHRLDGKMTGAFSVRPPDPYRFS